MTNPLLARPEIPASLHPAINFLFQPRTPPMDELTSVSLFSSGGVGDVGYEQAGFRTVVQSELNGHRCALGSANFPETCIVEGALAERADDVVATCRETTGGRLQLLSATPPCQGMSSSNPGRGKVSSPLERDVRNRLLLDTVPIVRQLEPRVVVVENVVQVLKETVNLDDQLQAVVDAFGAQLPNYRFYAGTVQMADYGVPQTRKRAVVVGVHRAEECIAFLDKNNLLPWPRRTHSENASHGLHKWITLEEWLSAMEYFPLDARDERSASCAEDALHFVPHYEGDAYLRVADIPPRSGQNAYHNPNCRSCGRPDVPPMISHCPYCKAELTNRPYVRKNGEFRLVKGFKSSYRRMWPDRPAPTVTTATSHIGSDYKIHPWENRVLSVRECGDLQTVPRFYDWRWCFDNDLRYVMRQVVGEALPPLFTYRHGIALRSLLTGNPDPSAFTVTG